MAEKFWSRSVLIVEGLRETIRIWNKQAGIFNVLLTVHRDIYLQ
jgi:hypothetical protein